LGREMPEGSEQQTDIAIIRELARRVADNPGEDPELLERLALLASARAKAVRAERRAERAKLIAAIRDAMPEASEAVFEQVAEATLVEIEGHLEELTGARSRHDRIQVEIRKAVDAREWDRLSPLAKDAKDAETAITAARHCILVSLSSNRNNPEYAFLIELNPTPGVIAPSPEEALTTEPSHSTEIGPTPSPLSGTVRRPDERNDRESDIPHDTGLGSPPVHPPEIPIELAYEAEIPTNPGRDVLPAVELQILVPTALEAVSPPEGGTTTPSTRVPVGPTSLALEAVPSPEDTLDAFPGRTPDESSPSVDHADRVWAALHAERLGLAYALVSAGALGSATPAIFAPALRLTAAALTADGTGIIYDEVGAASEDALTSWSNDQVGSEFGLAALTLLLPALSSLAVLTPGAFTSGLMQSVLAADIEVPALHPLRELARVADQSQAQIGHAAGLLASLVSEEHWRASLTRFVDETREWLRSHNNTQFRFAAATDLWRAMLRPDKPIGGWLQQIIVNENVEAATTRDAVESFDLVKQLRSLEIEVRGRPAASTRPIEGPAFQALCKAGQEAIDRVRNWITLVGHRPPARRHNQDGAVVELRQALVRAVGEARQTLSNLPPPLDAGATTIQKMLDRLDNMLAAQPLLAANDSIDKLIGRDLLACPDLRIATDWKLLAPIGAAALPGLLNLAANPPPTLSRICDMRLEQDDFIGAMLTVQLTDDEVKAAAQREKIDIALAQTRDRHIDLLERSRRDIETADRAGRLEAGPAQEMLARIEDSHERLKGVRADLPEEAEVCLAKVQKIEGDTKEKLGVARDRARERIQLRLDRLTAASGHLASITKLLDGGHFAVAEDMVDRLEAGEEIDPTPPPTVEAVFDAFFPLRNQSLADWRATHGPILRGFADSPLAVPGGQGARAEDITICIDAWTVCAGESLQQITRNLPSLLGHLGFTDPELVAPQTPKSGATEAMFRLRARPLRERGTSLLPEFGSSANGSYALLCIWKKRDVQAITEALARQPVGNEPTIVLFFAPLDSTQRRRLSTLARTGSLRSTIVIDELLALHLASLNADRLTTLFACTLPFTDAQPWAETGTPSPEMFFGRQLELRDVETLEGGGAHLIYGGRQLGKTALLRQVERNAEGNPSIIVCYLNIAQVGVASEVQTIWQLLSDELSQRGAGIKVNATDPARAFSIGVRDWLKAGSSRRIILLLDEADEFFRNDREGGPGRAPFAVTRSLSELANITNRRFKPIFAGLRNVQKLARDPNSPLAHLGTPRVIGPMIRGQERQHAEQLVRWPFAALGYRLTDEVVTRILAFANYYPSLIQVVCQRLLRGVRERQGNAGPPWKVGMDNVAAVLETRDLRAATYERFRITLELDPRYQLLTLVMAWLSRDDPHMLAEGIRFHELREWAASYWPQGFPADFSDDAFDALLSEMVGLGLLRDIRGTHVALRSANLAHLIGSKEKIDADLEVFADRPAPPEADPAQARRIIGSWPSLLTSQQEGVLLADLRPSARSGSPACFILAGIALADIRTAEAAIRAAIDASKNLPGHMQISVSNPSRADPENIQSAISRRAGAERPALWIVKPDTGWTADSVAAAAAAVAALPSHIVPTRIVFIADAARAWEWCGAPLRQSLLDAEDPRARVGELSAGPWTRTALDLWLKENTDLALPPEDILARTGGWDRAIHALRGRRASTSNDLLKSRAVVDALGDIRSLHDAVQVLSALNEVISASEAGEAVTADALANWDGTLTQEQIARALTWAQLTGAVQPGRAGLELNPLLRVALLPLVQT
jgi:hypothetical protein